MGLRTPGGTDIGTTDTSGTTDTGGTMDTGGMDTGSTGGVTFTRHTIDDMADGPAYLEPADVNGDGHIDLISARFGPTGGLSAPIGSVVIYYGDGTLTGWTMEELIPTSDNIAFPNHPVAHDLDGDDDIDIIVPIGFLVCEAIPGSTACGGLVWFEQTDEGWVSHDIVPYGDELFYHWTDVVDFDGDGIEDIVTTGERQFMEGFGAPMREAYTVWFRGVDSAERFDPTPLEIGAGGGSFPRVLDIDGDGDLDVASAEYFVPETSSFAWFERTADPSAENPSGTFVHHTIAADVGPSIQLSFIEDLHGDGELIGVGANHTNEGNDGIESAVFTMPIPDDPTEPWTLTTISEGINSRPGSMFSPQAAPGIFGHGDIDGDGDIDILVSGDGDQRTFWIEQTAPGTWSTHVLEESMGQAGGVTVIDINGDGANELIMNGYEDNLLVIYERD